MKRILGLDLGTTSIGWALIEESSIVKLGVRVNPLTVDEKTNFEKGRPLSTNADRTLKRGMRRNLQRYKQRRKNLIDILLNNNIIKKETALTEIGKNSTHQTLSIRAAAAHKRIELEDLAKVLLAINKKRGYKSSRKASNDEEGQAIDGMAVAKQLYEQQMTPGQYVLKLLKNARKYIPDFYRSDLQAEFDSIWKKQKQYYPDILTRELYKNLQGKNKTQTWAICRKPFGIVGIKRVGKTIEKTLENYEFRTRGLHSKLELEYLAIVLQEINNNLNKSSGYLGAISDRSKELFFKKETVGQNLYRQILKNPHTSLKNQVFYRQDYLDEFEKIWTTQSQFHSQLTKELKEEIRDVIIFYQRKLKSQKSNISFCQLESWKQEYIEKETGKTKKRVIGRRVVPKSSFVFQEFKIWQNLNHLVFTNTETNETIEVNKIEQEIRDILFQELNLRGDLSDKELLKLLKPYFKLEKITLWKSNFDKIEGNRTNAALFNIYQKISEFEGYGVDWKKLNAPQILDELNTTFPQIGIDARILKFDAELNNFDQQASYQLWHLLYSVEEDHNVSEEDKMVYGNSSVALKKKLHSKFGFKPEYTSMLTNAPMSNDYGNLSARAIRRILPYLRDGHKYAEACSLAGYRHSKSLSKDELKNRVLKDKLVLLPKNSLRNPVVEKILNQMVNVVNQIIDTYGKPQVIKIELARELKKSAKERAEMSKGIADATSRNDEIRKLITQKFGIPNPTKNDVTRYRLYDELASRGHKDIFTNTYISVEELFTNRIDIEHIIPKALLFDDSYSNKTLAFRNVNLKKDRRTALDFIAQDYNQLLEDYKERVETWHKEGSISRGKRNKLLMGQKDIPDEFIERDLRNSQYIARKAKAMLFEVFEEVIATTGSITDKLRSDWGLINVMKELNLPKYRVLGLTEFELRLNKQTGELKDYEVIKDWTKRNDHRHHAMDALTVAFTTHNHIQYINNLNARHDTTKDNHPIIKNIENTITEIRDGKRMFKPPLPRFRESAKNHIETILISFKNKNKVVTKNLNKSKLKGGKTHSKIQLTPRGQLHKETIYGKSKRPMQKPIKISKKLNLNEVSNIIHSGERKTVQAHLQKYNNNPEVAFDTKTLKKDPLFYKNEPLKQVLCFETIFTIRKDINPENFKTPKHLEKIVDQGIKTALNKRLEEHDGNFKTAFSDLEKNPIWFNKEKGISIKRAAIYGVSNAEPLHWALNHLGNKLTNNDGKEIPVDYVSTGNNHHVAIYKSNDDTLDDEVISFYEAVVKKTQGNSIVRRTNDKGWPLLFTLKQNEMFVFPSEDFVPKEEDLLDPKNQKIISQNLFRVQKFSKLQYGNSFVRDYVFRHHHETELIDNKKLKDITYKNIKSLNYLKDIVKVRLNHLGQIVQLGEY